jgi:hypothetical protein
VVEALGFLVGQGHHLAGTIRETFKHRKRPPEERGIDAILTFLERW